jgi:hypothetical protein
MIPDAAHAMTGALLFYFHPESFYVLDQGASAIGATVCLKDLVSDDCCETLNYKIPLTLVTMVAHYLLL